MFDYFMNIPGYSICALIFYLMFTLIILWFSSTYSKYRSCLALESQLELEYDGSCQDHCYAVRLASSVGAKTDLLTKDSLQEMKAKLPCEV